MNPLSRKGLIAALAMGMLTFVALACSSSESDEPVRDDSPAVVETAPSPRPEPTSPPTAEPSPGPTEIPAASSESQSASGDPWGDDPNSDPFRVTSVVENGRRLEIMSILPKDAIRAVFSPNFLTIEEGMTQYRDTDLVIGVSIGGESRAYNVAYLSGHEIVNDVVGGKPIAVTW